MGGQRLPGEAELLNAVPALRGLDPAEPTKLPLEARMYGIFAGFLAAWGVAAALGRTRAAGMSPPWLLTLFVAFVGVMGLDGLNATLYDLFTYGVPAPYLYAPRLDLRLATGLLSGIGIAGMILPLVNYALWSGGRSAAPVFASWTDLLTLLVWNGILFALVVSGSGLLFYPVSFFGVLGLISLVGALNLTMLMSIFPPAGPRTRPAILNSIALAVLLSGLELGALALVRYALLGTATLP